MSGTGGIIGMNGVGKGFELSGKALLCRTTASSNDTKSFCEAALSEIRIIRQATNGISRNCINYGTIYCYRTHYSGGIMGQWTGTGGTIENCRNYGMLQTSYGTAWIGASAGIVAQLYHAQEGQEYNVIGCGNYGSVFTKMGVTRRMGRVRTTVQVFLEILQLTKSKMHRMLQTLRYRF